MKNSITSDAPYTQDDCKSQRGPLWPTINFPRLRVRYTPYTDHFYGQGGKWIYANSDGVYKGAAFESYTSFIWGIAASF